MVVNEVGIGKVFGQDDNDATIIFADGSDDVPVQGSKDLVAEEITNQLAGALA